MKNVDSPNSFHLSWDVELIVDGVMSNIIYKGRTTFWITPFQNYFLYFSCIACCTIHKYILSDHHTQICRHKMFITGLLKMSNNENRKIYDSEIYRAIYGDCKYCLHCKSLLILSVQVKERIWLVLGLI